MLLKTFVEVVLLESEGTLRPLHVWNPSKIVILWFIGENSKAARGHDSLNQPPGM